MYTDLITIQFEHEYFPVDQPLLMDCGVCDVSDGLVQSLDLLVRSTGNELVIKYKADRFDAEEILDAFADESLMLYLMPADPKLFFQVTSGWAHAVTYQRTLEQEGKTRTIDKECNTFLSFNLLAPDQLTITGVAEHALDDLMIRSGPVFSDDALWNHFARNIGNGLVSADVSVTTTGNRYQAFGEMVDDYLVFHFAEHAPSGESFEIG